MITDKLIQILSEENERISWDKYFLLIAILISSRSPCHRLKVGSVIVKDNRILAAGYNGFLPGAPHTSRIRDNHEMSTVHAEVNAITDCAKRGVSVTGSRIYITHFPCIHCFKSILASGISDIYYHQDYNNDELVYSIAEENNIKICKIE